MLFRCIGLGGALGLAPPVLDTVAGMGRGMEFDEEGWEARGLLKAMSFCIGGAVRGWMILATPAEPPACIGFLATEGLVAI